MARRIALVLALIFFAPAAARADEVIFNNGDRVVGKITRIENGRITIENTVFGTVTADLKDVKSTMPPGPSTTTAPSTAPTTLPTTAPSTWPATSPTTLPAAAAT